MLQAILTLIALAGGDGGPRVAPKELRLFPMGTIDTSKGPFTFDQQAAALVMAAYQDQGNDLFFDYDHRSLSDMGPPDSGKAAGWFGLELRPDGLWAVNVRWTPMAQAQIEAGEWRYFSPAFLVDENRRIRALLNVALTNNPATKNMTPLVAASARWGREAPSDKDTMNKTLLVALGLAETATDAEALAFAQALTGLSRDLLALSGKATPAEALATVKAWQESHAKLGEVQAQLTQLRAAEDKRAVEEEIRLGKESAKITGANEAKVRALGSAAAIKAFLETALPVLPANAPPAPTGGATTPQGKPWEQLTRAEKHRLYNDDRPAYEALKQDHERRTSGR